LGTAAVVVMAAVVATEAKAGAGGVGLGVDDRGERKEDHLDLGFGRERGVPGVEEEVEELLKGLVRVAPSSAKRPPPPPLVVVGESVVLLLRAEAEAEEGNGESGRRRDERRDS
jgi:hypothetical protein